MSENRSSGLIPKPSRERSPKIQQKDNTSKLEVLERFREEVEAGGVNEFIICGISPDGQLVLATDIDNVFSAMGILEVGKSVVMASLNSDDEED